MGTRALVTLAVLTLIAVGGAVYLYAPRTDTAASTPAAVQALTDRLNDVARIELIGAEGRFSLQRGEGGWVVPERANYPAEVARIREFVMAVAGLDVREARTAQADNHHHLGLHDPGDPASPALQVVFLAAEGDVLIDFVVGDQRPAVGAPGRTEAFVRFGDDPQSWLAEAPGPFIGSLGHFVERTLLPIEYRRVRRIEVAHADGEYLIVRLESPDEATFALADLGPDEEVIAQYAIDGVPNAMTRVEFDDVRDIDEVDFLAPDATVTVDTFDGLEVVVDVLVEGAKRYGRLRAQPARQGEASEIAAEADLLNARWDRWAFDLEAWRLDDVLTRRTDLVQTKTSDVGDDEAAADTDGPGGAEQPRTADEQDLLD